MKEIERHDAPPVSPGRLTVVFSSSRHVQNIGPIAHWPTGFDLFTSSVRCGNPMPRRRRRAHPRRALHDGRCDDLTEAGYVGEDVENIILKLLQSEDMQSSALAPYLQRVEPSASSEWSESTVEPKHLGAHSRRCPAVAPPRRMRAATLRRSNLHREHRLDRVVPCRDAKDSVRLRAA